MDATSARGKIVVGVDGSEASMHALDWAAAEAGRRDLGLYVLHAIDVPLAAPDSLTETLGTTSSDVVRAGQELLDSAVSYVQETWPSVQVQQALESGGPSQVLLRLAESAFLVVLGSRGRGGFTALLLGSVSSAVGEHAKCPVIVVRTPTPKGAGEPRGHFADTVVVGVDGSRTSLKAVEFAFEEASFLGIPLTVFHASWDPFLESSAAVSLLSHEDRVSLSDEERLGVSETLAGMRDRFPDVAIREVEVNGRPAERLVEASTDATLLVLGSRGLGGFAGMLLGSVSRTVLQHARCPVAIVRAGAHH